LDKNDSREIPTQLLSVPRELILKKAIFSQFLLLFVLPSLMTTNTRNWKKELPLLNPLWMMTSSGLQHQ